MPDGLPKRKGLKNQRYLLMNLIEAGYMILRHGWTYQQALAHYGWTIPKSTIAAEVARQKAGADRNPVGRPGVLTDEEESWLAAWVRFCGALHRPPSKRAILERAYAIAAATGRTFNGKHGRPGNKWWKKFSKVNSLKSKLAGFRDRKAYLALTRETLDDFYKLLWDVLDTYKIPIELLWAADETGFQCHDDALTVVVGAEVRNPKLTEPNSQSTSPQ
jgi:hypothetical protein